MKNKCPHIWRKYGVLLTSREAFSTRECAVCGKRDVKPQSSQWASR